MRPRSKSLVIGLFVLVAAMLAVWKWPGATPPAAPEHTADGYYVWGVEHLKAGLPRKDFILVNVHIPDEGRISKTDLEIPYDKVDSALEKLPADKSARIVLYCKSGRMSDIAARRLAELGFTNVASLRGGMVAWQESGEKIIID